jgi:hypothetical protein
MANSPAGHSASGKNNSGNTNGKSSGSTKETPKEAKLEYTNRRHRLSGNTYGNENSGNTSAR